MLPHPTLTRTHTIEPRSHTRTAQQAPNQQANKVSPLRRMRAAQVAAAPLVRERDVDTFPAAVAGMLPRRQAIARASVSALVASLPLLYVSLLRRPPAALAGDTAFWFLMSNCVIAAIVATSGDAGTLLFRSAADDDDGPSDVDGCVRYCASAGQLPAGAVKGISRDDGVVPLAAAASSMDEPPAVDVDMNGGRVQGVMASAATSGYSVDHALPSLLEGEEEDEASETSADTNHLVQQRGEKEEEEAARIEPSSVKNNTVRDRVEAQGNEEDSEVIPLAIIEDSSELELELEPEPWSRVVRSTRGLPEEEAAADGEWPIRILYSSPPDQAAARDKGVAAAREGELRRSATVGSRPAAEESEYWKLSDEELNRRVEDFIVRFNREMRLQIEQEAGA